MAASQRQQEGKEAEDGWSLGLSIDWEKRLKVDPAGSLRELRRLCGRARPATEKLERTYWQALLAGLPDSELAAAVLLRLRPEADFRQSLLQISGEPLGLLHQHFKALAVSRLGETEIEPSEWTSIAEDALCLGSNTLEDFGKLTEAAALYALSHDLINAEQAAECFERLALRFGICRSLFPPEKPPGEGVKDFLELAKRTLEDLYAEPLRELSNSIRKPLRFELYFWMGKVQAEIGELEAAAENFKMAAERAEDADDQASSKFRRASMLEKLGRLQEAFAEFCEAEPLLQEITDETLLDWWYVGYWQLKTHLQGGIGLPPDSQRAPKVIGKLPAILARVAQHGAAGADLSELAGESIAVLTTILADTPAEEAQARHGLLLSRAVNLVQLDRHDEAEKDLVEAEALESSFSGNEQHWESVLFRARLEARRGELEAAKEKFARLLPQRSADREKLPEFLGYYLEAVAREPSQKLALDLVGILENISSELLGSQPTAGARARQRTLLQRPIESAILCLVSCADESGCKSPEGQQALARAWTFYQALRNPELRATSQDRSAGEARDQRGEVRQLERAFHGAFRRSCPELKSEDWALDLERLQQHEAAFIADSKNLKLGATELPRRDGLWLVLFQVSELLREPLLLVLAYFEGVYSFRPCQPAKYQRLADWNRSCLIRASWQEEVSRQLVEKVESSTEPENEAVLQIEEILPPEVNSRLSSLALKELITRGEEKELAAAAKKFPVYLYPSGQLHTLLFEMLPEKGEAGEYFGSGRAIRSCLKSAPEITAKLDLKQGWLGVGGIPANEPFSALPGAREEILGIQRQLIRIGVAHEKACVLEEGEATVKNLEAKLVALSPVVLHLAVHGIAHENHPEACALVLAPSPGQPEQDLLYFRKIRQLPLEGVELVVLSACGSLVGRSNHSSGMQGLAWAFLDAGARQVIASRYKVGDTPTRQFMEVFYRWLTVLPPPEALGRARQECSAKGMSMLSVGAWSIWS